jgi:hypothetical protein
MAPDQSGLGVSSEKVIERTARGFDWAWERDKKAIKRVGTIYSVNATIGVEGLGLRCPTKPKIYGGVMD